MDEDLNDEANGAPRYCEHCQAALRLGVDVLTVEHGVIGPRGVVPLDGLKCFCSEACLRQYFGNGEEPEPMHLRRRIP